MWNWFSTCNWKCYEIKVLTEIQYVSLLQYNKDGVTQSQEESPEALIVENINECIYLNILYLFSLKYLNIAVIF